MRQHHLAGCGVAFNELCDCEPRRYMRLLWITVGICVFQVVGGVWAGSLALFSDSVHVASDGASALISVYVAKTILRNRMSKEAGRPLRRFWMRVSGVILILSLAWIMVEAFERFAHPAPVNGWVVIAIAAIGAAGNVWQHRLVPHDHSETAAMQRLHVEGDLYSSIVVVLAGIAIAAGSVLGTDLGIIDPFLSVGIALFVGYQTVRAMFGKNGHACHGHAH